MKQRRCPKIQLCPTCGRMRIHHPGNRLYDCPVPPEVTAALAEYARKYGRNWRAWLVKDWRWERNRVAGVHPHTSHALAEPLKRAENLIGPRRLRSISPGAAP